VRIRPHITLLLVLLGALVLLALLLAAPAYAAVVGEWRVNVLRGSSTVYTATGATQQQAWDAGEQYIGRQAPGTSTYTLQTPRYVARVVADPAPICTEETHPRPANEEQTGQCPAGTTGSWPQSRAYVSAPYPTCWTAGPWVPAEPPTDACVEPPPPPPPPPTGEWTHCAAQGATICADPIGAYTGTRVVRFGVDTRWVEREIPSGSLCNSATFGGINPAQNALKTCEVRAAATEPPTEPPPTEPPPTGAGTIALSWIPPAHDVDGVPLTDLIGYRPRCSVVTATVSADLPAGITRHTFEQLVAGSWTCQVTAYNPDGESPPSESVGKVIP
jgi:hypothetical protein